MIWKDVIAKSDVVKKYAAANGAQFAPVYGDDAVKAAMPAIQTTGLAVARSRQVESRARHRRHFRSRKAFKELNKDRGA